MTKLITVHGTGSGLDSDLGVRWWQEDSPFLDRLGGLLDLEDAEVMPFHWGQGANSEKERRRAGEDLHAMLASLDEAGEDYALIGHSHGGMVIYNALQVSAQANDPLKRLTCWCTVGTPFLDVRPRPLLAQRLDPPGLAVLSLAALAVFAALTMLLSYSTGNALSAAIERLVASRDPFGSFYLPLMLGAGAFAVLAYGGLFVYEWWRDRWYGVLVKRRVAELYAHNWIGFVHADDEALGALRSAKRFRPEIVPRNFLAQAFAMLPVVLIGAGLFLGFIWLEARLAADGPVPPWLENSARAFVHFVEEDIGGFPGFLTQIKWVLALIAVFALATGLVFVFKAVGRLISIPLAAMIDKIVWRSLRNEVWGDDMGAEAVRSVSSHPPLFPQVYGPIAEPVASRIAEISDEGASETLKRLRQQIGMLNFGSQLRDPFANAMSQLSWHELIHTTYFEVEPFIRMIALSLHRHGVAGLRREAWPAEAKAATRNVLERMQIEELHRAGDLESVDGARQPDGASGTGLSVEQKTLISIGIAAAALLAGVFVTSLFVPLWSALVLWALAAVLILLIAELRPVSLEGLTAKPQPATGFASALDRFEAMRASPEAMIHPRCRASLLHHGRRMPVTCVLVHGISNCPYSMIDFAPQIHALDCNVLVARMPFNGHLDNGTDALRYVTAENLRAFSDQCVDIAAGMGEQVVVLGISAGGVVTGWMAQNRDEIDHAILVAPSFGLSSFGTGLNTTLMRLMLALPHFSIWKDPVYRSKAFSRPHSYKRQSTRGIGEVMRLGLATTRQASQMRAAASRISVVTNGADTAVDPEMIDRLVRKWREHAVPVDTFEFAEDLGLPHELIDPSEKGAQPELVYPRLLGLIRPGREGARHGAAAGASQTAELTGQKERASGLDPSSRTSGADYQPFDPV